MTRLAYDLGGWEDRSFRGDEPVTQALVDSEEDTFRNARLWDYRPLKDTLDQLQTVRRYYTFPTSTRTATSSTTSSARSCCPARELAIDQNPSATGWVNQRIVYTHGIGVAMVPVNEVTNEGQPRLFIGNLPPQSVAGRADDHRAADLLRRAAVRLRRRRRQAGRVRLSDRRGRRRRGGRHRDALDRHDRREDRHDPDAAAVLAPVPRPRPAHQRPGHREQPAAVPPVAVAIGSGASRRSSGTTRTRTSSSTASGRLVYVQDAYTTSNRFPNAQSFDPLLARGDRHRSVGLQLHPQQRQDHGRRVRRDDALLRRRSRRPDHPRLRGGLPDAVHADRPDARRPARPPARSRGAVQRPDADVRSVSRHRRAAVLPQRRPVDGADRDDQRADAAVRGVLRRDAHAGRGRAPSSCCSSRWSRPTGRT